MMCHGREGDRHAPRELEYVETGVAGHGNLKCPSCGVRLETDETVAERLGT